MKINAHLWLALAVVCFGALAVASEDPEDIIIRVKEEKRLTMDDARKIALVKNPDLETTLARIKAAQARVMQARAAYYPTLDLEANSQRTFHFSYRDTNNAPVNPYSTHSVSLNANYLIFDGLARHYSLQIQKLGEKKAKLDHEDVKRRLIESVAATYFNAMLERQNVVIAIDDQTYNKKLRDDSEKKLKHGTGTKSDVLNFEIQAKNADANRLHAELNYKTSLLALSELLGIEANELSEDVILDPVQDYTTAPPLESYETLCEYALNERPDLRAIQSTIQQQDAGVKSARSSYMPTLNAYAEYGMARKHNMRYRYEVDHYGVYGIRLNWNFFNGFRTYGAVSEAVANRMEAESQRKALEQSIRHEIAIQLKLIEEARQLADLKKETEDLAQQARDLVQKEYNIGRVTATRLNEAQTALTSAQVDYIKAVISYWQYRETLRSTTARNLEN